MTTELNKEQSKNTELALKIGNACDDYTFDVIMVALEIVVLGNMMRYTEEEKAIDKGITMFSEHVKDMYNKIKNKT